MKLLYFLFLLLPAAFSLRAQKAQTIVPDEPVVIGTAFQVQYVLTGPQPPDRIQPPSFAGFRLVSGPHTYTGTDASAGLQQAIHNITYTLVPLQGGFLNIEGITAFYSQAAIKSNEAVVEVIEPPKQRMTSQSSYTELSLYAPTAATDREALIRGNLFIVAEADRRSVRVGEPVVVSFTLYSRLQSESEVVKTPGFYGFSVVDMLPEEGAQPGVDTVDNKIYNIHLLRKVQLYPVQAGRITVEALQTNTEITFLDSGRSNKKLKVTRMLESEPFFIDVRPLPKAPLDFTGGVGQFTLHASLPEGSGLKGQGELLLIITGKGNFIQLAPPSIYWPPGLEAYEPSITEELVQTTVPVEGQKTYRYPFTSDSAGQYVIPPVSFSYFNPVTATYQTVRSDSIFISLASPGRLDGEASKQSGKKEGSSLVWLLLLLPLAGGVSWWLWKQRKTPPPKGPHIPALSPEAQLQTLDVAPLSYQEACFAIRKILYQWMRQRFGLTSFAPDVLQRHLSREQIAQLHHLLTHCEQALYSGIQEEQEKEELKKEALALIRTAD